MPFSLGSPRAPLAAASKSAAKQKPEGLKHVSIFDEAAQKLPQKEAEGVPKDQRKGTSKGNKQCQKAELNQTKILEGSFDSAAGKRSTTDEEVKRDNSPIGRKAERRGSLEGKKAEDRDGSTGKRASSKAAQ